MSGIVTPILDTLLHQVLGKRVDTQESRQLFEPVKPVLPGRAPRAVHSDSSLNSERTEVALPQSAIDKSAQRSSSQLLTPTAPSSTTTHFSHAARTIADILVKFPAPPSVIRPQAPLISDGAPSNVQSLAAGLQQSIEASGLFYESHLARWYRGGLSRAALELEPQTRFQIPNRAMANPGSEAAIARQGEAAPTFKAIDRSLVSPAPLKPDAAEQMGRQGMIDQPAESPQATRVANMGLLDDMLQGIVRHQLELMVTPTLRWEGDLWSGIFMALMIQVPEALDERAQGERGESEDDDAVWHSQLNLELPRLGALDVQLHMRSASLSLILESDNERSVRALAGGREELEERLRGCGFEGVRISILKKSSEDALSTGDEQ